MRPSAVGKSYGLGLPMILEVSPSWKEVKRIINLAKHIGGVGFVDMEEEEVELFIPWRRP